MNISLTRVASAAAFATLLAACGGSSNPTANSSPTPSLQAQFRAYAQCLQQHGVTLPTNFGQGRFIGGGGGGGGQDTQPPGGGPGGAGRGIIQSLRANPAFAAASQACASLRPSGFGRGRGLAAATAYLNCLRSHGVVIPTPTPSASGQPTPFPTFDRTTSTYQQANSICKTLLPNRGRFFGG
ncbi:MAG: hypothetical protein ACYDCC_00740 [Actinomycetota bacterium]